jgi:serine/threonine protein kinase
MPRNPFKRKPKSDEKKSITSMDGIPFMAFSDFKKKYPFDKNNRIDNNIFIVNDDYVVKHFAKTYDLVKLVRELNVNASISHPCILKPLYWSQAQYSDPGNIYFLLERGENIRYAFRRQEDKISFIKRMMFDTMSALNFLHKKGIIHGNIKPENIVYHENRIKLTNLSLSVKAELNEDNQYYIRNLMGEPIYQDIEFSHGQYNNINCEIYSLFMAFIAIIENKEVPQIGELSNCRLDKKYEAFDWFFIQAGLLQRERPSLDLFLDWAGEEFNLDRYIGTRFEEIVKAPKEKEFMAVIMGRVVKIARQIKIKVESLFLALNLLHRIYKDINFPYRGELGIIYGCVCIHLAMIVNGETLISYREWSELMEDYFYDFNDHFDRIILDILKTTKGIISTVTYWDYAKSSTDLLPLLIDTINWKYDNIAIRELADTSFNKCIRVKELDGDFKTLNFNTTFKSLRPKLIPGEIKQCALDLEPDVHKVEKYWSRLIAAKPEEDEYDGDDYEVELIDFIGVLMHNRDALGELDIDTGRNIFSFLLDIEETEEKGKLAEFILNTICHFNWVNDWEVILKADINPFSE